MGKKPHREDQGWYTYRGYDLLLEGKRWVVRDARTAQMLSGGHRDMRSAKRWVDIHREFG